MKKSIKIILIIIFVFLMIGFYIFKERKATEKCLSFCLDSNSGLLVQYRDGLKGITEIKEIVKDETLILNVRVMFPHRQVDRKIKVPDGIKYISTGKLTYKVSELHKCSNHIYVRNESNSSVYFGLGFNYPDTTINFKITELRTAPTGLVVPYYFSESSWEEVIDKLPSDTLSVFIFDGKTVDENNWKEVKSRYMILKRYDLSMEDLNNNNRTITYPPKALDQ